MRDLIRRLRIPKLYLELGIIALGAVMTGLAILLFDVWPYLVNWGWFIAGMFFGVVVVSLILAFFAFGARGDETSEAELEKREAAKRRLERPRIVHNGKPNGK